MKYFTFLLFAFVLLISCKSENTLRDKSTSAPTVPTVPTTPTAPAATANVAGGAHYICTSTGCTGAGAANGGNCTVCGNALAHNQAFHNQTTPGQANTSSGLSPLFTSPNAAPGSSTTPAAITPPTPEPAQNANGVWHYTCSNGCSGGAGSATACASCGTTLAHNQGYH